MFKFLINTLVVLLLLTPECYAARKKGKGPKGNSVLVKVVVFERNSKTPVYRGPVSIIGFSGTKKGETNADGIFQAEFPGNDTVAVAIKGAVGYRDTTSKSVSLKNKQRTLNVTMRRNNKEEPLHPPTPTPRPQPTNTPKPVITTKPPVVPTPRPPYLPSPQPPLPPAGTPQSFGPPVITKQPQSTYTQSGQRVLLSVSATGSGTLTYQWKLNGNPVASAKSPTFSFAAPFSLSVSDRYFRISCVVSNKNGSVESNTVVVYILQTNGNVGDVGVSPVR